MTLTQYLYATGPEGAALTLANTGASTQSIGTGSSAVFAAAVKGNGSNFGGLYTNGANALSFQRFNMAASNNLLSFAGAVTLPSALSNANLGIWRARATATAVTLYFNPAGNLVFADSSGAFLSPNLASAAQLTAAGAGPGSKLYYTFRGDSAAGTMTAKVYTAGGTLIGNQAYTGVALTGAAFTAVDVGVVSNTNNAGAGVGWADLQLADGSTAEIGPLSASANLPPTVSVGASQNVTAGATVTLTSTASDPENAPMTRLWSFDLPTSGAPGLLNPTAASTSFTAGAAGALYVLRHTVTDSAGLTASATTEVRVPLAGTTDARPVPGLSSSVGTWTPVGISSLAGALADETDTTYDESPALSVSETSLRVRWQPTATRATSLMTLRLGTDTGTASATIRLLEGATIRQTWTQALTATATDYTFTLSSGTLSAITDWSALYVEIAG